jgi:hypothetical protein
VAEPARIKQNEPIYALAPRLTFLKICCADSDILNKLLQWTTLRSIFMYYNTDVLTLLERTSI